MCAYISERTVVWWIVRSKNRWERCRSSKPGRSKIQWSIEILPIVKGHLGDILTIFRHT